jgi:hypothetical protein
LEVLCSSHGDFLAVDQEVREVAWFRAAATGAGGPLDVHGVVAHLSAYLPGCIMRTNHFHGLSNRFLRERGGVTMNDVHGTLSLEEIARRLDEAGIPWAVFAGAAAMAYGARRPLTDIDILTPATAGERVMNALPEADLVFLQHGILILALPGFDILAGMGSVDLDARMVARLTQHRIGEVSVPVIPPEDNILIKAKMGRGPEEGKHDWEDIEEMMAHLTELDWEYLQWRAEEYLPSESRPQVLQRLEGVWHRHHPPQAAKAG